MDEIIFRAKDVLLVAIKGMAASPHNVLDPVPMQFAMERSKIHGYSWSTCTQVNGQTSVAPAQNGVPAAAQSLILTPMNH